MANFTKDAALALTWQSVRYIHPADRVQGATTEHAARNPATSAPNATHGQLFDRDEYLRNVIEVIARDGSNNPITTSTDNHQFNQTSVRLDATEARKGIVELATQTEAIQASSTTLVAPASTLSAAVKTLARSIISSDNGSDYSIDNCNAALRAGIYVVHHDATNRPAGVTGEGIMEVILTDGPDGADDEAAIQLFYAIDEHKIFMRRKQSPAHTSHTNIIPFSEPWEDLVPTASDSQAGIVELATQAEANALSEGTKAITPGTVPIATATQRGVVELATQAEANALSDAAKAITPDTVPIATATQRGIVELADSGTGSTGARHDSTGIAGYALTNQSINYRTYESPQFPTGSTNVAEDTVYGDGSGDDDITMSHGLGRVPRWVRVVAVAQSAGFGYSTGDEVVVTSAEESTTNEYFLGATPVANQTGIRVHVYNQIRVPYLSSPGSAPLEVKENAQWKLKVYAGI
ncbi:MAG: hypothetical protein K0U36_04955 [Alphaproteobacteria bacterium]|nr:hypothetical protein [Alphaproteobacteria bacterium]